MTTKEQERKALAQIKKIMDSLEADSYINTAFAGCLEIAESNIENDWACSMKDRAESAEAREEAAKARIKAAEERAKSLADALQAAYDEINKQAAKTLSADDLTDCRQLVDNEAYEAERQMKAAALEIVTFAEDPTSQNFKDAVINHRNALRRYDYNLRLRGRIEKAMSA